MQVIKILFVHFCILASHYDEDFDSRQRTAKTILFLFISILVIFVFWGILQFYLCFQIAWHRCAKCQHNYHLDAIGISIKELYLFLILKVPFYFQLLLLIFFGSQWSIECFCFDHLLWSLSNLQIYIFIHYRPKDWSHISSTAGRFFTI